MKFRKYFKKNANGKIEFTPEELRVLLDEVYENGKSDGYASGKASALSDVSFWEPAGFASISSATNKKDLGDYIAGVNEAFAKAFPIAKSTTQAIEDMSKQLEGVANSSSTADILSPAIEEKDISCTSTETNVETPTNEYVDGAEPKIYSRTFELPNGKLTIKSTNSNITPKELSKQIKEIFGI